MKKLPRGFTIIELLIAVVLIGILSGLVIAVINPRTFQGRGRDAQRVSDLKTIQSALELYFSDNRRYPISAWTRIRGNDTVTNALTSGNYINSVPVDPMASGSQDNPCGGGITGYNYRYRSTETGTAYVLTATMENANSNQGNECNGLNRWSALGCSLSARMADVCYGVENP